jgi:hypothetical protein
LKSAEKNALINEEGAEERRVAETLSLHRVVARRKNIISKRRGRPQRVQIATRRCAPASAPVLLGSKVY